MPNLPRHRVKPERRAVDLLRDALARVVWIREEHDPVTRDLALEDLEHDLAGSLSALEEAA
jgi:hypothetical protein